MAADTNSAGFLYEAKVVPYLFRPFARPALATAQAVGLTGRVVGLDMEPAMLNAARQAAAAEGLEVQWWQGNAQELPFEQASFDAVLCLQGVQFFPDLAAALREMRRVLRPQGRVALTHCFAAARRRPVSDGASVLHA